MRSDGAFALGSVLFLASAATGLRLAEQLALEKPGLPGNSCHRMQPGNRPVRQCDKPYRLATLSQALSDAMVGSKDA